MGPQATDAQYGKVLDYVTLGQQEGARLVTGGEKLTGPGRERGYFVSPAVFTELEGSMRLAQEEVFGPVLGFQRVSSFDEALKVANDSSYGLSAGIVTQDLARALAFARGSQTGLVKVNQPTSGVAMNAPFGGLKNSSTQTYKEQAGETMMHFYTQEKTIYVDA
jgi:aldehyde dehydrogenase (NAD+)